MHVSVSYTHLDEPTNHLDIEGIHWLAEHLKGRWRDSEGALLLVTHDRWFLDEVCLDMWEVHDRVVTQMCIRDRSDGPSSP